MLYRCTTLAVGVMALTSFTLASAQDKDAEKLFRDMEKKIKSAKAIDVAFTYALEGKPAKGNLLLTADNKTRLQISGPFFFGVKGNARFDLVSDGKRYRTQGGKLGIASNGRAFLEPGGTSEGDTGKALHDILVASLCRSGVGPTVIALPYSISENTPINPDDQESRMTVYDFKARPAEKVGTRQAKVILYRHGKGGNDDAEITLSIDAENGLPLRREFVLPRGDKLRFSETYAEFRLNPKIEAKSFELPK